MAEKKSVYPTSIERLGEHYYNCLWKYMMAPWRYEQWVEEINHIDYPEFPIEAQAED